jgi:hypothetical protein
MEIGEIEKGKDKIIISVKEFKGRQYVDVRTFFANDEGEWIPTKKGVTLSPETVDDAIRYLQEAKKQLK